MNYNVNHSSKIINANIELASSKSISNRVLIIQALAEKKFQIERLSESDDTQVMLSGLSVQNSITDIGHAGTAMRFLTAYYATQAGSHILTGSERMKERPIKILVNALRRLGAHIEYLEKDGFAPLLIKGKPLSSSPLEIDGSVSSQYITALLLISPYLPNGLKIKLKNRIISQDYISMTLELMKYFCIEYDWEGLDIHVLPGKYNSSGKIENFPVEADWSGASYWYSIAALANEATIVLNGLFKESLQGDSAIQCIFNEFGIQTIFQNERTILEKKSPSPLSTFEYDFTSQPDLAQTVIVACGMLRRPFVCKGLHSLRIKETDRIKALQNELDKLGINIMEREEGTLIWDGIQKELHPDIEIKTYDDHRMAMAFAPCSLKVPDIKILEPQVVSKSYPDFWEDLRIAGFELTDC